MRRSRIYLITLLSMTLFLALNSCSKDDNEPETELPSYMEEKVPFTIGSQTFMLSVLDNVCGRAFKALLPFTISMADVNGNEKFYKLKQSLPTSATTPGTIQTGDLNLYGSDGLVLFYKTFTTSYAYTRIGTVDNPSTLASALGSGSVSINFGQVAEVQHTTLTYNINGADNGSLPEAVTNNVGTAIRLDNGSGFSRNGFTFDGWNTNSNGTGTNYAGGSNYPLTNNVTLYAKWKQVQTPNNRTMKITVGSQIFTATLATNETATVFKGLLPMTINMSEHNNNEKFYGLSESLPTNASNPGTIQSGDLMLYGSSTLVVFYKTFSSSYSYTRIGSIDNPSGLQNALGSGSVTVTSEMQYPVYNQHTLLN